MHGKQNCKAILDQFDRHMSSFSALQGPDEILFQHWEWMMRQHYQFAKLINELGPAVSSLTSLTQFDRARCSTLYHLQLAAKYAVLRRKTSQELGLLNISSSNNQHNQNINLRKNQLESDLKDVNVEPSEYLGGFPKLTMSDPQLNQESLPKDLLIKILYLGECSVPQCKHALQLLEQVLRASIKANKNVRRIRTLSDIQAQVANEQYLMGNYFEAISLLIPAIESFHRDRWFILCEPLLEKLFLCAINLQKNIDNGNHNNDNVDEDSRKHTGIDSINDRRSIIHSAFKLISLKDKNNERKKDVSMKIFEWLHRPLLANSSKQSDDGTRLNLAYSFDLDDMELPLFNWICTFSSSSAIVGQQIVVKVEVQSLFPVPTGFDSMTIIFNDPRYEINVYHDNEYNNVLNEPISNCGKVCLNFQPNEKKTFSVKLTISNLHLPEDGIDTAANDSANNTDKRKSNKNTTTNKNIFRNLRPIRAQMKLIGNPDDREILKKQTNDTEKMYLSGISLWSSTETSKSPKNNLSVEDSIPLNLLVGLKNQNKKENLVKNINTNLNNTLEINEYKTTVSIDLEHDEYAMVHELYPLLIQINSNQDIIENGFLWITCDPPVQSKSDPFFFRKKNDPMPLSSNHQPESPPCFQPDEPLNEGGIQLDKNSKFEIPLFCLFNSLPYPSPSSINRQFRTITIKLIYTLSGTEVKVESLFTYEIPCYLPFTHKTRLIPRNQLGYNDTSENIGDNNNKSSSNNNDNMTTFVYANANDDIETQLPSLQTNSICYVELSIQSSFYNHNEIDILDIIVEPGPSTKSIIPLGFKQTAKFENIDNNDNDYMKNVSILFPSKKNFTNDDKPPLRLKGGDNLSLGFDLLTAKNIEDKLAVLGHVSVTWIRANCDRKHSSIYTIPLPRPKIDFPQFKFKITTSTPLNEQRKVVGKPFHMILEITNVTEIVQELLLEIQDCSKFFREGTNLHNMVLPPLDSSEFILMLVPICSGNIKLPSIIVNSKRLMTKFIVPSTEDATLFIAP